MNLKISLFAHVLMLLAVWATPGVGQQSEQYQPSSIEVLDPSLVKLIDPEAKIEALDSGHQWIEGPVWITAGNHLLFSDVPRNVIHKFDPAKGQVSVFMNPSGYDGPQKGNTEAEPGSNGLSLDQEGRLLVCDHGNRRVYRVETNGAKTTLADRFEGHRFNSPNDLVLDSRGNIYFTDPPYGIGDETKRELDYCGVFRIDAEDKVTLLTKELKRPNGIALSPNEDTIYVAQSLKAEPVYMAWPLSADGKLGEGRVLFDATDLLASEHNAGLPDGMAVDVHGNLWATGPGGVLIISPDGKLLGRIITDQMTANCTFGGDDGSTLYMTSTDTLYRVPTRSKGL